MSATRNMRATAASVRRAALLAVAAVLGVACLAEACSVPVFRYALDHWTPDSYRIRVLHDGPLPDDQTRIVQNLQEQVQRRSANAVVEVVDVALTDDATLADLYRQAESHVQPHCVIQAPTGVSEVYRDVWSGPLSQQTIDAVVGSPAREQLIKSLLAGTSVVWIYLDAGDAALDNKNYELLTSELERLQGELKLPEIDPIDLKELSGPAEDVKLQFTSLRLSRTDPAESLLVEMLLSTEPDLRDADYVNQPMAFPVFGRGRVLYSLVGEGITAGLIEDACRFLTGACQCTVKAQNPGAELLLSVDWDGIISPTEPTEVDVTLTGLAGFRNDANPPAAAETPSTAPTPVASTPESVAAPIDSVPQSTSVETGASETGSPIQAVTTASPAAAEHAAVPLRRTSDAEQSMLTSPTVIVSILALIVVVGSFLLLPRR